jgi:uncharacterized membrane protein YbhN (UPF0104 family)
MIVPLVAAGLLTLADLAVRAARLRLLVGGPTVLRTGAAIRVNAYGDAASAVTPARLGGEPARFLALTSRGVPKGVAIATLGLERLVDMGLAAMVAIGVVLLLGRRGFADLDAYLVRFAAPNVLPWLVAVAALVLVAAVLAVRFRTRFPRAVAHPLQEAVRHARDLSAPTLLGAVALTALSMAARVAILPVLLSGYGVGDLAAATVGSFALIYAQLLLPTPAGAGGVELGFVVGVAPLLSPGEVAGLLVTWRVFTLFVPAGLGLVVFLGPRKPIADSR